MCEGELHQSRMDYVENNDIHHAKVTGVSEPGPVVVILYHGPCHRCHSVKKKLGVLQIAEVSLGTALLEPKYMSSKLGPAYTDSCNLVGSIDA